MVRLPPLTATSVFRLEASVANRPFADLNYALTVAASAPLRSNMELLEWFAFDGLILPIFIMAMGGWMIHSGPKRSPPDADAVASLPAPLRFLASLRIERPVGIFMVVCGLVIGMLRLGSMIPA